MVYLIHYIIDEQKSTHKTGFAYNLVLKYLKKYYNIF